MSKKIDMYTDGACWGNPGDCGVGVVLLSGDRRKELSQYIGHGTNNMAECHAVIVGLEALKAPEKSSVTLYTDSRLVEGLLSKGWKAKKNTRLIRRMKSLASNCNQFKAVWVKAHNGNTENERADELAGQAIRGKMS